MASPDITDFDYTTSLAAQTLDLMSKHAVLPSPDNFSIWFQYASRTSADLNKTIDVLIGNRKPFDAKINRDLVRIYLLGDQQADLSEKLRHLVGSARDLLTTAIDDQNAQITSLQDVTARASKANPTALIGNLLEELVKASSRARSLEASFARTSQGAR